MTYNNPIIPGFHPDPSICRVGDDFYLVNSSFEYFPGIPLFHSKDLVHWQQIGHCITRELQITLAKGFPNSIGIYAPTIRYYNGRFYVITTNVSWSDDKQGNFVIWTDDIHGEWSDPIWIDLPGIDPSLFFDDDGKVYYTGTSEKIFLCEIDINTGALLSERKDIWAGTGGCDPEGPHIYHIHGYYYLLISEGGTSQGHMLTIARSKNIDGPYEPCDRNPILSNRSLSLAIKAVGHGDIVQASNGSWWCVCLGIRPVPYPDRHHLGRETFLAPVQWDEDLWPVIGNNGTLDLVMEADTLAEHLFPTPLIRDHFDTNELSHCWNFLYQSNSECWSLTETPGSLTLKGNQFNLNDQENYAWIGRRQEHMFFKASTELSFQPTEGEEAGLSIFLNCTHHYEIALTMLNHERVLILRRRIGSLWKVEQCVPYSDPTVILHLKGTPNTYTFSYTNAAGEIKELGSGEVHYLSTEVGGKFTGNYIALYATGNGKKCKNYASFKWFDYLIEED